MKIKKENLFVIISLILIIISIMSSVDFALKVLVVTDILKMCNYKTIIIKNLLKVLIAIIANLWYYMGKKEGDLK